MTAALIIVVWVGCGILTTGMTTAHFYRGWPTLQDVPGEFRRDLGFGCLLSMFGPLGLIIVFLLTGFAQRGLMYRNPERRH